MKLLESFIFLSFVASTITAVNLLDEYDFFDFLRSIKPPPVCPPNEVHKICVSNCSDCIQRGECMTATCTTGCDCMSGFYRIVPNGICEPVAKCPKPECGENEIFRECGPVCETCVDATCRIINCDHKCYCKEGYLRNEEGICIPMENCSKREHCNDNEEWAESGFAEEFCLQEQNGAIIKEIQNVPQCYCKEEYRRNMWGNCINETFCPIINCFGVEVYHNCIPKCNTTCRNYGNPNCTEDDNCYPGCFCPRGYVMDDFRSCIPVEECSLDEEEPQEMKSIEKEKETTNNETTNFFALYTLESIRNITAKPNIVATTENFTDTENIQFTTPVTLRTEDFKQVERTATLPKAPTPMTTVPTAPITEVPIMQSDFKTIGITIAAPTPSLPASIPDVKPIDTTVAANTPSLPASTPDVKSIDTTVAVHTPSLPASTPDFKSKDTTETKPSTTPELKKIDPTPVVSTATPEIKPEPEIKPAEPKSTAHLRTLDVKAIDTIGCEAIFTEEDKKYLKLKIFDDTDTSN